VPGRGLAVAAGLAVVLLAAAGCSSGDSGGGGTGGGGGATTTTTRASSTGATTTTPGSTAGPTSTTLGARTNTTTSPAATDPANASYQGKVDGRDATVTFTRVDGAIRNLTISSLTLDCLPTGTGQPTTRKVSVALPRVPQLPSGVVEFTAKGEPYSPSITGTFTSDGTFAATVLFSGARTGYACGGEFPFTASPR
jgi:hypothetical protein